MFKLLPNQHALKRTLARLCAVIALIIATSTASSAAGTLMSIALNGGTLSWTSTYSTGVCNAGKSTYGQYSLTNFVYSYNYPSPYNSGENIPVSVSMPGVSTAYFVNSIGQPYCPNNGPVSPNGIPMTDAGNFYRVWFTAGPNGGGSATMESFSMGGVAPKYLVLGVIYAPPGPGSTGSFGPSYVDYTNTTQLGTNTTWSSSFANGYSYSTSGSLLGITLGGGAEWTQETDDSTSIAVTKETSVSDKYPGISPASTVGLNHDNDIVLLWLNPALLCTAEEAWTQLPIPAAAQCLIYDPMGIPSDPDSPQMDVVQIPVGELNGHFSMQSLNPDLYQILQNHGVTSADYPTIAGVDPYASCGSSISCVQGIGANSTRFDGTGAPIVNFGNNCNSLSYTATYSSTTTAGQGASTSYTITNTLTGSQSFIGTMTEILKSTQTWTNKWSEATSSMTGQSASITVNQPCSGYSGPSQFRVYKDNIYGSFMLYPTQ
jgi:hypothetical protein